MHRHGRGKVASATWGPVFSPFAFSYINMLPANRQAPEYARSRAPIERQMRYFITNKTTRGRSHGVGEHSGTGNRVSPVAAVCCGLWHTGAKTPDSVSDRIGTGWADPEFYPGYSKITLNPDVIFFVVLPPLLFSAAWVTNWREFSYNLVSILFLAFGLVLFTVLGVARLAPWFFTGFDWRMGFVLGAVVAPTDAIAATSIAKQIGLPKRIVDILEGESLVNDASGLLALEFGVAMLVRGETATISAGGLRLVYLTAAGIAIGLLIGIVVYWVEKRIDHGPSKSLSA